MTEKIHVLLPVHNRRETTRRFIECLRAQTYSNYHLILIDDGSTDGTADMVLQSIPGATVIRGKGDWWWAGGLQQGLDWLKGARPEEQDVILFINDDVLFDSAFLDNAIAVLRANPRSMVLSRLRDRSTGEVRESGVHADFRRMTFAIASAISEVNCLSTRGLFIRWADVRRIGDFHPRLLPHYLSDYEYTVRGRKRGLVCVTSERLSIEMDRTTTGFHDFSRDDFRTFVGRYFSRKSAANPFFWSAFMLFAAPFPWKVLNLFRIWKRAGKAILLKAIRSAP
jgi:GT2 family glycosyltransferase